MAKSRYKLVRIIRTFSILLLIILPLLGSAMSFMFYAQELKERREELTENYFAKEKKKIQLEVENLNSLIKEKQKNSYNKTKKELNYRVDIAHRVALNIYNSNKNLKSQKEIEKIIMGAVREITFNNKEGIFFVIQPDGTTLLNPKTSEEEEQQSLSFNNKEGKSIINDLINSIKESKSGIYTFYGNRDNIEKIDSEKIAYIKEFKPYGWIIGSEINIEDINNSTQRDILNYIKENYDDDYFFVGSWDGVCLFGNGLGENFWKKEDINGKKVVQELIQTAKNGGGFVEYQMPKNVLERNYFKKTSYTMGIKEWKWYFGTGVFTEELSNELTLLEDNLQKQSLRNLKTNLLITITLGLIIIFFSILFVRTISNEFNTFRLLFKNATLQSHLIDTENLQSKEFFELAAFANTLLDQKANLEEDRQRLRSLETVGFLAGGIAHEFNNILAGIFGNIELANTKMKKGEPGKEFLETALDSMDTARELTGRLLTFSEGGNPRIEKIECRQIKETLVQKIADRGFPSEINFKNELPMILADEKQLNLIWDSLLNNIKEALNDKKEIITIKGEQVSLTNFSESKLSGEYIRISITDKGPGIPHKYLAKIFDPYFSTKEVGNGLGLSTVYTIINRHKGHIDIKSIPNRGTTVIIHLPAYIKN